MTSYHRLLAIGVAFIAISAPLTNWSNASRDKAKATAWGECVRHHSVAECDDYAP